MKKKLLPLFIFLLTLISCDNINKKNNENVDPDPDSLTVIETEDESVLYAKLLEKKGSFLIVDVRDFNTLVFKTSYERYGDTKNVYTDITIVTDPSTNLSYRVLKFEYSIYRGLYADSTKHYAYLDLKELNELIASLNYIKTKISNGIDVSSSINYVYTSSNGYQFGVKCPSSDLTRIYIYFNFENGLVAVDYSNIDYLISELTEYKVKLENYAKTTD